MIPYGDGAGYPVQRYRDVLKVWAAKGDGNATYVMLGIEEQTRTDYGMAVRCALFDAISYAGQISSIRASYERKNRRRRGKARGHIPGDPDVVVEDGVVKIKLTNEEFLSGMRAEDRLVPVITALVYLGDKPWDGPHSLHETLDMPDARVARLVPDYRLNLVSPANMGEGEYDKFRTDLGFAFNVLAHRASGADEVISACGHRRIDRATATFLNAVADLKLEYVEEEGGVNMCLALENRMRRERAEGRAEGLDEGMVKGAVRMGVRAGMSAEDIVDAVVGDYGIDRRYVEELVRGQGA